MQKPSYARTIVIANSVTKPVIAGMAQLEMGSSKVPLSRWLSLLINMHAPYPLTGSTPTVVEESNRMASQFHP
jgi:hypothetical protein